MIRKAIKEVKEAKEQSQDNHDLLRLPIISFIEEEVEEALSELEDTYEFYRKGVERMSPWWRNYYDCDDGVMGASVQLISMTNDSSYTPKKMRKFAEKTYSQNEKDVLNDWYDENEKEMKELGLKKGEVNYSDLYDIGEEDLAESLDEYVREHLDDVESYKGVITIKYFNADNDSIQGIDEPYMVVEFSLHLDSGYANELGPSYASDEIYSKELEIVMVPEGKAFKKYFSKVMKNLTKKVFM